MQGAAGIFRDAKTFDDFRVENEKTARNWS